MHRGAFCQFPFRWIYYYDSNEFTEKETGKNAPLYTGVGNQGLSWEFETAGANHLVNPQILRVKHNIM